MKHPARLLLALAVALTGCASVPPASTNAPADSINHAATQGPAAEAIPATPTPEPLNTTLGVRRPTYPELPMPELTAEQSARFGSCIGTVVSHWTKGACSDLVQDELKKLGFLKGEPETRIGVPAVNAILRYQRSRALKPTGAVDEQTWYALASGREARSKELPAECLMAGTVLCVDQGAETLSYMVDGEVKRTFPIRTGGFAAEAKTGEWRLHPTANGLFRVYNKNIDPPSENYGYGVMPYSVMFDPNMYVHYSADFKKRGYTRSSHGCVNIGSLDDAKWIYANTPIDARVYVW